MPWFTLLSDFDTLLLTLAKDHEERFSREENLEIRHAKEEAKIIIIIMILIMMMMMMIMMMMMTIQP